MTKEEQREYKQQYYLKNKEDIAEKNKQYYLENRDTRIKKSKQWSKENKEYRSAYEKKYREENKEKIKEYKKQYQKENKEKIKEYIEKNKEKMKAIKKEYDKQYREENKEKIKEYKREHRKEILEQYRKYINKKIKTDIKFKTSCLIRNSFRKALNGQKIKKINEYGIDIKAIIENLGEPPNDGKIYHIDHIFPVSAFDLTKPGHIKACWHPDNLQWLEASENLSKGNKYDEENFKKYLNEKIVCIS